jgi:hypothetical protein
MKCESILIYKTNSCPATSHFILVSTHISNMYIRMCI